MGNFIAGLLVGLIIGLFAGWFAFRSTIKELKNKGWLK
jgi:uncharacterized membrane protein YeaQ/YmgE (transglycosylase-associated protein family)